MSKSTVKVVELDTNPAVKSLKDLRKELMEYKNQMANLEEGSDAFLEVANKAGEVKHQIDEINESMKGASADFGDMVGNVTNVAAGITGAFQAVAGGLQAMGVESEALDKTIAKMQGLMAVTQGLSAIDDGIKSFDKLTVLMGKAGDAIKTFATNLGQIAAGAAIVAAIGFAFAKLKEHIDGTNKVLEERETAQKNFNTELEKEILIRKKAGLSEEELINFEIAKYELRNEELKKTNQQLQAQNDAVSRNASASSSAAGAFGGLVAANAAYNGVAQSSNVNVGANTRIISENTEEINNNNVAISNLKNQLDIIIKARELAASRTKTETKAVEDNTDVQEKLNKTKKENYENEKTTIEYLINLYKELDGEDSVEYKKEYLNLQERKLSNIKSYFGETSEEYKTQLILVRELRKEFEKLTESKEKSLSAEDIQLGIENDRLKQLAESWLKSEETAIDSFDRIENELKLSLSRRLIEEQEYKTASENLEKARAKYIAKQTVDTFAAASNLITSLLDGMADQQDQNSKEGFEKSKKMQIASATIQMLTGIVTAFSGAFTNKLTFADWIMAGIQAATIATTGAMNINKIKNTKFDGGGAANVSAGAINNMIVPPVQFSQAVQGATTQGVISNQKVYVLESDIVNTTKAVVTQMEENTY